MRSAKAVVSEKLARIVPAATMSTAQRQPAYTTTSLKRWSVATKALPAISQIRSIHVYDFDNTLFLSPLPNPQLWNGQTIGLLQTEESFANGGWWHDPNLLAATGQGIDIEEPKGWKGWWNENILRLVQLSMQQKDALTVLLTGRGEDRFADIVKRMVASQNLEFDMIGLKPEVSPNGHKFPSTAQFKQKFLEDLIFTYEQAEDIRVYEDRVKHVKMFRDYFEGMNMSLQTGQTPVPRRPITAEVIQVSEGVTYLDPTAEIAEVQRMINSHHLALRTSGPRKMRSGYGGFRIRKTVLYTGYLISKEDQMRLIQEVLGPILPQGLAESKDIKYTANNIMIAPRPASKQILDRIGGAGKKVKWQVTGTANFENKVWAARVQPIPGNTPIHSENAVPLVVLACRKPARPVDASLIQNWHPVPAEMAITFQTEIGEKEVLSVDETNQNGDRINPSGKNNKKRQRQQYEDGYSYAQSGHHASYDGPAPSHDHPHGHHSKQYHYDDGPRRGSQRGRGRGSQRGRGNNGRGGRGRGRGGGTGPANPYYKSLDDSASGFDGTHSGGNQNGGYPMDY
ncbi:hypothetical protein N7509_004844 [Penicillium cosmopolitanum]|uniref:Swiss Army Knife RNA repair protein HAD domain-containing protein n=1 Tax=Penicillium cosmopolitanum TaxID=1131564 RepID=A0A9W9W1G2_9EURO|nr:uncharacterized protein N7509_004844 [Penicillium cosmopolitanum]KAJ5396731.1 hypothetical protein N7509_004844 [Penicillium cosmopolitanum]